MTGERHAPAVLPPGKRPVTYLQKGVGPKASLKEAEKISPLLGLNPVP